MSHGETARPQPEEVSQEEKPKFDLDKEAAAAKAETEAAPPSQFSRDADEYRGIGEKLAKKEKEKLHVNEASEALGKGSHAAEVLARSIDSDIADLNKKKEELLSGYPDNGKAFLEGMAAVDKLSDALAKKEAKLKKLEKMKSYINYPGGERGAKAEIAYLKESVEKSKKELRDAEDKNSGLKRTEPTAAEKAAAREARIKAMGERVDAAMAKEDAEAKALEFDIDEEVPEEPVPLTAEMRKKTSTEDDLERQLTEEPIPLTPDMAKAIELGDEDVTVEKAGVSKDNLDAELLTYDAFREVKPITDAELAAAGKTGQLGPERQAELKKATDFLKNRITELVEGHTKILAGEKAGGALEVKSTVREAGVKELAKDIKDKYGVDIDKVNEDRAVSVFKRFKFGLKKLFNPGLRKLANEHDAKQMAAAKLTSEIDSINYMAKKPGEYLRRMQEMAVKMNVLRQKAKRPGPVVNVKVR